MLALPLENILGLKEKVFKENEMHKGEKSLCRQHEPT